MRNSTQDQTPPMATPRVAAGALFFDPAGRILVVRPSYKRSWDIPGGYVEPNESPLAACIREVHEELHLDAEPGALLAVDWAPNEREGDKLLFIFDGGPITPEQVAAIQLQDAELTEYAFRAPTDLADIMTERLARRLASAANARRTHPNSSYLEHGRTTTTDMPQVRAS